MARYSIYKNGKFIKCVDADSNYHAINRYQTLTSDFNSDGLTASKSRKVIKVIHSGKNLFIDS